MQYVENKVKTAAAETEAALAAVDYCSEQM